MRTTPFFSLLAIAPALLLAVTNVLSANQRRQNHGTNLPGAPSIDAQEQNETYPIVYPDPSLIRHPSTKVPGDDCSLTVVVDHSRCLGGEYRYDQVILPFDEHTNKTFKAEPSVMAKGDQYYAKLNIHLACNSNLRLFLTDTPEKVNRIGLRGLRIMTSMAQHETWIEKEKEELNQTRTLIAPLTYYYFSDTPTMYRGRIVNQTITGYDQTVLSTGRTKSNNLTIQWC